MQIKYNSTHRDNQWTALKELTTLNSTTFEQKYDKYERKIVMGDSKSTLFLPKLETTNWLDECKLDLGIDYDFGTLSQSVDGVAGSNKYYSFRYVPTDIINAFNDGGGMDMVITLYQKPPFKTIPFTYDTTKLVLNHQPELTADEIKEGAERPEHVVNSVAVYHSIRSPMHAGASTAEMFKTCKYGHLYRMQILGSLKGQIAYANWLPPKDGLLELQLDEKALAEFAYPLTIRPMGDTFGYTSVGASSTGTHENRLNGYVVSCPASGTVTALTAYLIKYFSLPKAYLGLHEEAGDGVTTSCVAGDGDVLEPTDTAAWLTDTLTSTGAVSAQNYTLIVRVDGAYFYYDTGTGTGYYNYPYSGTFPTDDIEWSDTTYKIISIYATYTESGGGGWSNISKVHGIAESSIGKINGVSKASIGKIHGVAV